MTQTTVLSKIGIEAWQMQVDRTTKLLQELPDEKWMSEIAPGKNRGIYLVGHLEAVHDMMPEILGFGKRSFPDFEQLFLKSPDQKNHTYPTIAELRQHWTDIHDRLKNEFDKMPEESWFQKHMSMTDADFEKNPYRNKLSVLLNRTNHLAYHFGQIRLLK